MTKRWSSVRSDLLKTKRQAAKEARKWAKREEWGDQLIKDAVVVPPLPADIPSCSAPEAMRMDIVERLESVCAMLASEMPYSTSELCADAAEEIRRLRALIDGRKSERCLAYTENEVRYQNAALADENETLQADNKRLKSLLENSEMTVAEVIDANERLRNALSK